MKSTKSQITASQRLSRSENLRDLKVSIYGLPNDSIEEWKCKIDDIGGVFHAKVKKDSNCFTAPVVFML
ncbi:hypothetical protein Fmac_001922 [Flemingia macrophylla]|uniref:Uncharacterized protein n=1 Tax=Flemingia macrophylla TaxID=520843 RepID=A0ABD1NIF7_9FABA